MLGVVRFAAGYVVFVEVLVLSWVDTFMIGATTSVVELTGSVLSLSEVALTVALLDESVLWVMLSDEELEETTPVPALSVKFDNSVGGSGVGTDGFS